MAEQPPSSRKPNPLPQSPLAALAATILGAGGPGREISRQLVALGVSKLTVVDPTLVRPEDIISAGFGTGDVGSLKADAVGNACHQANPLLDYTGITSSFTPELIEAANVFCCLDDTEERRRTWRKFGEQSQFWADVRVDGEAVSLFAANDPATKRRVAKQLMTEANPLPQVSPSYDCVANIAASLAVRQFLRHVEGLSVSPRLTLDLANRRLDTANDE